MRKKNFPLLVNNFNFCSFSCILIIVYQVFEKIKANIITYHDRKVRYRPIVRKACRSCRLPLGWTGNAFLSHSCRSPGTQLKHSRYRTQFVLCMEPAHIDFLQDIHLQVYFNYINFRESSYMFRGREQALIHITTLY